MATSWLHLATVRRSFLGASILICQGRFRRESVTEKGRLNMDIGKLIGHLINVGFAFAVLGILAQVTSEIKKEAMDTQRHGMVSLGKFNRRLQQGR